MRDFFLSLSIFAICLTMIICVGFASRDEHLPAYQTCVNRAQDALACAAEIYGGFK